MYLGLSINHQKKENFKFIDNEIEFVPHQIFNIGNSNPQTLMEYINCIENALGIKADKEFLPMQPGDVENTYADTSSLQNWINFKPETSIQNGIDKFVNWYKSYYGY